MFTENNFLVLYTNDVRKTRNFYNKISATETKYEIDKYVCTLGGFNLHFILESTEPHPKYKNIAMPDKRGQGTIFYLKLTDGDSNEVTKQIELAGGTLITNVFENHWGGQELLFEDPNGYKFAIYSKE